MILKAMHRVVKKVNHGTVLDGEAQNSKDAAGDNRSTEKNHFLKLCPLAPRIRAQFAWIQFMWIQFFQRTAESRTHTPRYVTIGLELNCNVSK